MAANLAISAGSTLVAAAVAVLPIACSIFQPDQGNRGIGPCLPPAELSMDTRRPSGNRRGIPLKLPIPDFVERPMNKAAGKSRIVMKFGGTSLADVPRIQAVAQRVKREIDAGHEAA